MSELAIFLTVIFAISFFLLCREIVCWYWKVNQQVTVLEEIRDHLAAARKPCSKCESSVPAEPALL